MIVKNDSVKCKAFDHVMESKINERVNFGFHSGSRLEFSRIQCPEMEWERELRYYDQEMCQIYLLNSLTVKIFSFIKTINTKQLYEELKTKNLSSRGLQLMAVHHIMTGPASYTDDDLAPLLQPLTKHLFIGDNLSAVEFIFKDNSPEQTFQIIHTVYGRFPDIEDYLVLSYCIGELNRILNEYNERDIKEGDLYVCFCIKKKILSIYLRGKNILEEFFQIIARVLPYWSMLFHSQYKKNNSELWIALVLYHSLVTQQHPSLQTKTFVNFIQDRITRNFIHIRCHSRDRLLLCFLKTCGDLETTPPNDCLLMIDRYFNFNLHLANFLKLMFVKNLPIKPDMFKSDDLKVLQFIAKWMNYNHICDYERKTLQLKKELDSILTNTDTPHVTQILIQYMKDFEVKLEFHAFIKLLAYHVLVTCGKHEQLTVVSEYLNEICDNLKPEELCLPALNPQERVEWIHDHFSMRLPKIDAMLKLTIYKKLLFKNDLDIFSDIFINNYKIMLQPIFLQPDLVNSSYRPDVYLVSISITILSNRNNLYHIKSSLLKWTKNFITESPFYNVKCFIRFLLNMYELETKPELEMIYREIIHTSIQELRLKEDPGFHKIDIDEYDLFMNECRLIESDMKDMFTNFSMKTLLSYMEEPKKVPSITDREDMMEYISHLIWTASVDRKKVDIAKLVLEINKADYGDIIKTSVDRKKVDLAKFELEIYKAYYGDITKTLTLSIAPLLDIEENTSHDSIIYKCYCIVRHHNKLDCACVDGSLCKYTETFPFLKTMETKDKMEKLAVIRNLIVIMVLLQMTPGLGQASSQLKKYLALKYQYEDAILYLLWCSGDVEINPGPTMKKLKKVPDSQKERSWMYDTCSVILKVINGWDIESKTDGLWKRAPNNWPEGQPFYDPRNKPKGGKFNGKSDEVLLNNLISLCEETGKRIPQDQQNEIKAWKSCREDMFKFYISRTESKIILEAIQELSQYKYDNDLKNHLQMKEINCILPTQNVSTKNYPDIERDIATTLCRLSQNLPITEKSDGIWKTPPPGWNPKHKYYSPCNAGKRTEKGQDTQLVTNLITYCETIHRDIPPELKLLVNAWKTKNSEEVRKQYTIWANVCIIDHSLKYLEIEGYLDTPQVQQCLDKLGITRITTTTDKRDLEKVPSKQSLKEHGSTSIIINNDSQISSTSSYRKKCLQDKDEHQSTQQSSLPGNTKRSKNMSTDQYDESITLQIHTRQPVKRKIRNTADCEPVKKAVSSQVKVINSPASCDTIETTRIIPDTESQTRTTNDVNSKKDKDNLSSPQENAVISDNDESEKLKTKESSKESVVDCVPDISEQNMDIINTLQNDKDFQLYFETDDYFDLLGEVLSDVNNTGVSRLELLQ